MNKFERVLSDEFFDDLGAQTAYDNWVGFGRKVEQAVLAKLAEQEPVAKVSKETFSSDGTSDIITNNLPIGTPLYAHPMPCVSPTSDKIACVSEIAESDTQKHVTEEYKRFCDWCDANPSFDLDSRLHTSGGTIDNGGYISDEKTRIAFAAWRAAKKGIAAPKEHHRSTKNHIADASKMVGSDHIADMRKKLLNAGRRGVKSTKQDLEEAIDSIKRAIELLE